MPSPRGDRAPKAPLRQSDTWRQSRIAQLGQWALHQRDAASRHIGCSTIAVVMVSPASRSGFIAPAPKSVWEGGRAA
jgi:hypothetical protein